MSRLPRQGYLGIAWGGFVDSTSRQNSDSSATLMPRSAKAWARSCNLGSVLLAVRKKGRRLGGERIGEEQRGGGEEGRGEEGPGGGWGGERKEA